MRIALLEDDPDQAALAKLWLESATFEVVHFESGAAMLDAVAQGRFDLFVLDWLLPGLTGIEVLRQLRAKQFDQPVLFLTQFDNEEKVVEALEAGADDYVAKPAVRAVLLARVKALLRRRSQDTPAEIEIGNYRTDSANRAIVVAGTAVTLTEREFDLAKYLLTRGGKVVTRAELLKNVWHIAAEGLETRTIDTHMSKLRKKLSLDGTQGLRLTSIYNHGYRLETVDPV